MQFKATQFTRSGVIHCNATIQEIFPLLCPKREEEWIPGWECEVIWSDSGYNEEGAIFRTLKPYGTELFWITLQYDINNKVVDFLITAPHLYVFRFKIKLGKDNNGFSIAFMQVFTSISEKGNAFLERYRGEDFKGKLKNLEELMDHYLQGKRRKT
ncbi:MAG: hypothetical protein WC330_06840 [Candidatus Omnitrophota bacterium]|jgi:hypothetical protein